MAIDDDVRALLHRVTPMPEVAVDADVVRRRVRRRRSRTVVVAAALSVGVVVGGVSAVALGSAGDQPTPSERSPDSPSDPAPTVTGWQRLPDMPLSPRRGSLTVWTGDEFLVFGGYAQEFIGGPIPIANLRDGAGFDPDSSTWRSIAAAPVALGSRSTARWPGTRWSSRTGMAGSPTTSATTSGERCRTRRRTCSRCRWRRARPTATSSTRSTPT